MKKLLFILGIILLFFNPFVTSFAQNNNIKDDNTQGPIGYVNGKGLCTFTFSNGRFWQKLDPQSKIILVHGIEQGMWLLAQELSLYSTEMKIDQDTLKALGGFEISDLKSSEIMEQIDLFYKDSANRRIPIIEAYRWVYKKLNGYSEKELDSKIESLRKYYNK